MTLMRRTLPWVRLRVIPGKLDPSLVVAAVDVCE